MWRLAVTVPAVLLLAGCTFAASGDAGNGSGPAAANPPQPAQAVAAALAFAAHSDPDVAVVDGYATLPLAVRRGEQPIAEHARPCAEPPDQPFTSEERATIRTAFHGRSVHFAGDPAAALSQRGPGAVLLVAARPLLGARHGTVMILSCVPGPQQLLVNLHWDGHAWQAVATGAG